MLQATCRRPRLLLDPWESLKIVEGVIRWDTERSNDEPKPNPRALTKHCLARIIGLPSQEVGSEAHDDTEDA